MLCSTFCWGMRGLGWKTKVGPVGEFEVCESEMAEIVISGFVEFEGEKERCSARKRCKSILITSPHQQSNRVRSISEWVIEERKRRLIMMAVVIDECRVDDEVSRQIVRTNFEW